MTEEKLLHALRGRDPAALEMLMDKYIPYISAIVWNILRGAMTAQDAEEVVSDVFLAAWDQAEQIRPGFIKAWLGAVARHKAKTKLRRMDQTLPLEEDILELPDEHTPADAAERAEERKMVRRAVNGLDQPDREIFLRHYYYAQTVQEISNVMRLNESTVKTKLRRGRMRLKTQLMRWEVL